MISLPTLAQETMEPWTCPAGFEGQTLSVFNWGTYISDEDDPDTDINENLIQNFERLCGVTVIYDGTMENNETLIARLRTGNPGWDIVMPTDYTVALLIREELIQPFNPDNIPNLVNMKERLRYPWYDPEGTYAVPYMWGTIGIGYDFNKVGEEITSWSQMFEHSGPTAWLEDRRAMLGIALALLGYDPNSENPDEIFEAADYLIDNSANVVSIAQDDGQVLLARGDVDMAVEYNGDIFQVAAECGDSADCTADFRYAIPEEGAVRWVDNITIPTNAPNLPLAEVFIDYLYDPQIAGINANFIQYGSPNQAAVDGGFIDQALQDNPGIYPTAELDEKLFDIIDLPDSEVDYSDAWETVKLAIGQ
jgi:spermidine/putrescine transport system substrate-binding protein